MKKYPAKAAQKRFEDIEKFREDRTKWKAFSLSFSWLNKIFCLLKFKLLSAVYFLMFYFSAKLYICCVILLVAKCTKISISITCILSPCSIALLFYRMNSSASPSSSIFLIVYGGLKLSILLTLFKVDSISRSIQKNLLLRLTSVCMLSFLSGKCLYYLVPSSSSATFIYRAWEKVIGACLKVRL
jgi:hypothetical protein